MNSRLFRIAYKYIIYYLRAIDEYSLHSPYIYNLYCQVIKPDYKEPFHYEIEKTRHQLYQDEQVIHIEDHGAGSIVSHSKDRKIKDIAKKSLSPAKQSRLLSRLIKHFNPENIIELGTSLGINTLYLTNATRGKVYTFEGCRETIKNAQKVFEQYPEIAEQIKIIPGSIDHTLPSFLSELDRIDLAFIDANHQYEPTIRYFEWFVSKIHEKSLIILDDIHLTDDMEAAWEKIKNHPMVTLSLDLFDIGILIFKPLYIKQHYILEY